MQVMSSPELAELTRESGLTRMSSASLVRKLTEQYRSMRASHSNGKEIFVCLSAADSCISSRGASDKEVKYSPPGKEHTLDRAEQRTAQLRRYYPFVQKFFTRGVMIGAVKG